MSSENYEKMDFDKLQELSEKCSNDILFGALENNTYMSENLDKINECKAIVTVFKDKLLEKITKDENQEFDRKP